MDIAEGVLGVAAKKQHTEHNKKHRKTWIWWLIGGGALLAGIWYWFSQSGSGSTGSGSGISVQPASPNVFVGVSIPHR